MPIKDITPTAKKIDKIIHFIENGDIKIPAFQRGFVWNQEKIIELLDSIYRDYPIGSILLWNTNEELRSTRNIGGFLLPDHKPEYPINYVLDGQQRLATIYGAFCKDRKEIPNEDQYSINAQDFNIYFDLNDERSVPEEELVDEHTNLKMSILFDTTKFLDAIKNYSEQDKGRATKLLSTFQNYEIPVVTLYNQKKEEVGIIFERINNTGTKLTTLDLMVAWTWGEDFHLRKEMDEILEILEQKGFGDTTEKIILQCASGIIAKTTKTKDILSLPPQNIKDNMNLLRESLEKAIDFLATELNVISRDFLPHAQQIVPMTYFFSKITTPNQEQSQVIKQWFWNTAFSKRYSGSTDRKMNDDIAFFENVINKDFSGIGKYAYTVNETELIQQNFGKGNPFTRALLLLLAQKKPLNLINGNKIDLGVALSKYNLKEYHHIFPRSFLKDRGVDIRKINSLCNFCFLPSDTNKKISKKSPSNYIFNDIPARKYAEVLESALMPLKKEIYQKNDYDMFLEQRAQLILHYLDSQLA